MCCLGWKFTRKRNSHVILCYLVIMVISTYPLNAQLNDNFDTTTTASNSSMGNDSKLIDQVLSEHQNTFINITLDLPFNWTQFCNASVTLPSNHSVNEKYIMISCIITDNEFIDFRTFRYFTSNIKDNVLFSLTITCSEGGSLFFPYPGRARLLHTLIIKSCKLHGYQSEMGDTSIDLISDEMTFLTLKDVIIIMTKDDSIDSPSSKAFECGPVNAVGITETNLTTQFINISSLETYFSQEVNMSKGQEYPRNHTPTSYQCVYNSLKYLNKSLSVGQDRLQLLNQMQNSFYPMIEVFNFSSTGIREIPGQFYDWKLLSRNLKYADLTHNEITDVGSFTCHLSSDTNRQRDNETFTNIQQGSYSKFMYGILDLRYNNISYLKPRNLQNMFQSICDNLLVDIRENPLKCDCEMKGFIDFLNTANHTGRSRYNYLYDLKCFNPPSLRGKIIIQLSLEQLGCEIFLTTIIKTPIIILCCVAVVVTVSILVGIRYRKEIIILAYTRLNIMLPCQQIQPDDIKRYDAFIAYSQADFQWVILTLAKRLENPQADQRFSLCLHHRDFVVGAAISNNIVQSVENSRHTIIVVSKNFLLSEWCRLEFRVALRQSLLEKKRHLIIILLEDIPSNEFEPELKRCMQTLTYVKADDRWFWDKIIYALSDYSKHNTKKRPQQ